MHYSVVDEGFEVSIHRSAKSVASRFGGGSYSLSANSEKIASEADIVSALRKYPIIRLYEVEASDWSWRIQKHEKINP